MPVDIIDTLRPKNDGNFPVAMANDIQLSSGERLEDFLSNVDGGGAQAMSIQAEPIAVGEYKKDIIKTSPIFFANKKKINENPSSEIDFHFYRTGSIVYVSVYSMLEQLTNSNKVRVKVPEGYRPSRTVIFELFPDGEVPDVRCLMKIEADGDVFVYHGSVEINDVKLEKRTATFSYITLDNIENEG